MFINPRWYRVNAMGTAQETQEKRPRLFEHVTILQRIPDRDRCPCLIFHDVVDYLGEPLRIYEWLILDRPIWDEKYIFVAFLYKGRNHRALMNYNEETHQLLESFKEKFRQGYGVLLTPYLNRAPEGWYLLLKPAV